MTKFRYIKLDLPTVGPGTPVYYEGKLVGKIIEITRASAVIEFADKEVEGIIRRNCIVTPWWMFQTGD